jgi:hypothetical protein
MMKRERFAVTRFYSCNQSTANLDLMDRQAVSLLSREDAACLLLSPQEIEQYEHENG